MRKMRVLPDIEMLEDRRMLTATMVGNILHIDGTTAADVITLKETKDATTGALSYSVKVNTDSTTIAKRLVSRIVIHGNAGNDNINVQGMGSHVWVLSIYGDDGNDTITGSARRDSILGGAGDDFILGMAANDTILGGAGNDVILGGDGNDQIDGEDGNDTLYGGTGNDTLTGGTGDDVLAGNGQYLALAGQAAPKDVGGNDVLDGGDGNDWLLNGISNAKIKDTAGHDTLTGGAGADVIDARGSSIVTDKNKADGDFVPTDDYTPAAGQSDGIHVRIKLTILLAKGKKKYDTVKIPAFIGYFNTTTPANIRTKAGDSIVYFDALAGSTWKLGDIFRMWGISFDSTHIGRYFTGTNRLMTVTIGGVKNTDFANAILPVSGTTPTAVVIKLG